MAEVTALVERAATMAGGDAALEALRELAAERTSQLQAAFAYAKRRARDPALSGAADVLELALIVDHRGAFSGARWWHYTEATHGTILLANATNLIVSAARLDWWAVVPVVAVLGASALALLAWRRRIERAQGRPPAPPGPALPASAGRIPAIAERVLTAGRDALRSGEVDPDVLADVLRGKATAHDAPFGHLFALGGLASAERLLAASFERDRRTLIRAMKRAREGLLTGVPATSQQATSRSKLPK